MGFAFPDPATASGEAVVFALDCLEPLVAQTAEAAERDPVASYLACCVHAVGELLRADVARRAAASAALIAEIEDVFEAGADDVPGA